MGAGCVKDVPEDSAEASESYVLHRDVGDGGGDRRLERGTSLIKPPRLRIREDDRQVTFTEFFFDILYVLPLQNMFQLQVSASGLAHFSLFWPALFNSWLGEAFFNTRFDTDDAVGRCFAVLAMVGVVGMASGIPGDEQTFAVCYAFTRLVLTAKYVRAACYLSAPGSSVGKLMVRFIACFTAGILLWCGAALAPEHGALAHGLAAAGLVVEYSGPFLLLPRMVSVHPKHMPERFACIVMLLFAGNLFALLNTMPTPGGVTGWAPRPIVFALLGVTMPVAHTFLYGAELGMDTRGFHRNMKVKLRTYAHLYLHMPLCGAVQLTSIAIAQVNWPAGTMGQHRCLLLCSAVASFLGVLGILHMTGAAANRRRAGIRFAAAALLALTPLYPWMPVMSSPADEDEAQYDAAPVLAVIVGIAIIQVLLDGLECVVPRRAREQ